MNSFVWITVIKTSGSAPRHAGAKMIVYENGKTYGTIGGGTLEFQAVEDAGKFLKTGLSGCKVYPLGPLLGQCCGGEVELFFEPVIKPKKIAVFGAGHIAEELVPMLKKLAFGITLIDERAERLNLAPFDIVDEKINELPSDAFKKIEFDNDLYIIVITHQHKHDEEIVEFCLDKPFKYLGMIGSKSKWEKFKARYKSRGFTNEAIGRITTPIGLDIGSETPFEISVSIVAEVINDISSSHNLGRRKRPENGAFKGPAKD